VKPASSLMVDGYVRVSRVGYRSGERFISPSVQKEQIAAWAQARPATVLEVWEELDESGVNRVSARVGGERAAALIA
jgi:hypothetical protein